MRYTTSSWLMCFINKTIHVNHVLNLYVGYKDSIPRENFFSLPNIQCPRWQFLFFLLLPYMVSIILMNISNFLKTRISISLNKNLDISP